jgi:hypothetical protein
VIQTFKVRPDSPELKLDFRKGTWQLSVPILDCIVILDGSLDILQPESPEWEGCSAWQAGQLHLEHEGAGWAW